MAKLTAEEKDEILRRDMPGYRLVSTRGESAEAEARDLRADDIAAEPEASTPEIEDLLKKYFGSAASDAFTASSPDTVAGAARELSGEPNNWPNPDDDEIVSVEPESKRDALDRGARSKSVIISAGKKKIIGSQG